MRIRTKLTLRFIGITAVIMAVAAILIYVLSADYRQADFYERLFNKSNNTAKLLIEVDEVDITLLHKIEQDNPVSLPNEKIIIFNYRDSILFSTDVQNVLKIDTTLLDRIRLEEEIRFRQGDYEILGYLFKGRYDRFVVIAGATDIYGIKRLRSLALILLIVFGISIVVVSVSGWVYAGKALQPIARVVGQVDEISITSLNRRVDEGNGKDEIAKLARTFNNMLTRIETSFIAQKTFISNASHELRTPLTAITGQLEVTRLNKRSAEEYATVIDSVLDDIKTLNLLANRLLLLAQSSSEEREQKMTPVRVDEMIWQAKEELQKHRHDFNIEIDIDEKLDDEERLTITGDAQLLRTAFSNLMENGCKYSPNQTVHVFIADSRFGLNLTFADKGIGIPQAELDKVFEPFYRGTNTKGIKGHGIGLSMVKGIVRLHKGTIQIESSETNGTTVTIHFPG